MKWFHTGEICQIPCYAQSVAGDYATERDSIMFEIDRHSMRFTQGDDVRFTINLKGRDLPEGTKAVFVCRETPWDPCTPAIEKEVEIEKGVAHVILKPCDTDLTPGNYCWQVRIYEPNDDGNMIILTPMEYAALVVEGALDR